MTAPTFACHNCGSTSARQWVNLGGGRWACWACWWPFGSLTPQGYARPLSRVTEVDQQVEQGKTVRAVGDDESTSQTRTTSMSFAGGN